jgi:hypothetical protein
VSGEYGVRDAACPSSTGFSAGRTVGEEPAQLLEEPEEEAERHHREALQPGALPRARAASAARARHADRFMGKSICCGWGEPC